MFTITSVNSKNFDSVANSFVGVMVRYQSVTRKDGKTETKDSAIIFGGSDFALETLSETDIFHAWRQIVNVFWETYAKQRELQQDNGGIRTKLKTATPHSIVFTNANRTRTKTIDVAGSVWSKIGLIPTTRDLEDAETAKPRDWKKNINRIAKASFDALKFRPQIAETKADSRITDKARLIESHTSGEQMQLFA